MNEKITFSDLVDQIAAEAGASKQLVHDLLIEAGNVTRDGLKRDGFVNLGGLGRFRLSWHEARTGRNPQTGEEIEIPAHSKVNYKAEARLRRFINRKYAHLRPEILGTGSEAGETEPSTWRSQPEEEEGPQATKLKSSDETTGSRRRIWWLLLIIPLVAILLIYLCRTRGQETQPSRQPPPAQIQTEEAPVQAESERQVTPEEAPPTAEPAAGIPGGWHTIRPGETLWLIAGDRYLQSELWPLLYRTNRNRLSNPDILAIGNEIRIHPLGGRPGNLTESDIEEIAQGYFDVYRIYKELGRSDAKYFLWVTRHLPASESIRQQLKGIDQNDLLSTDKIEGAPQIH